MLFFELLQCFTYPNVLPLFIAGEDYNFKGEFEGEGYFLMNRINYSTRMRRNDVDERYKARYKNYHAL
jgi:hypothetical protein